MAVRTLGVLSESAEIGWPECRLRVNLKSRIMCMNTPNQVVYHGSQKDFDKFDKDSMGLGGSDGV